MNIHLEKALCLPPLDIEALVRGQSILAIPRLFIDRGSHFALYPCNGLVNPLPLAQYYHPNFLDAGKAILEQINCEVTTIQAWARCELCQMPTEPSELAILSESAIWSKEGLEEILLRRQFLFLVYLRVYLLEHPIVVPSNLAAIEKAGKFIGLPSSYPINTYTPILGDRLFNQRKRQLEELKPPPHPELENFYSAIAPLATKDPIAQALIHDLKLVLGWTDQTVSTRPDPDLDWIQAIAATGNSSEGHAFEKLARRALLKLGFTGSGLNPDSTGGAGGLDFYSDSPYPIVGECKATKTETVSDGTPAQLLKLGMNHLGQEQYTKAIKLIIAAGKLNFFALRTATENHMNVISPETLQSLVELKAHYPGAINLIELKQYLQQAPFGLADDKVSDYIQQVKQDLQVRSLLVQSVKELMEPEIAGATAAEVRAHYNARFTNSPSARLDPQSVSDFLLELSSPLAGYLGRIKDNGDSDRFYFLRDLILTSSLA